MKCKVFEHHLPDWIGERLPNALAQQMQAHQASCPACQQTANLERALRMRWQDLPTPPVNTALWTRLAQRIDTVPPPRPRRALPIWAMGSAMAMSIAICGLLLTHANAPHPGANEFITAPPAQTADANPVEEHHLVQMVSEVQQLSDGESDNFFAAAQQDRQALHRLLQVKEGN